MKISITSMTLASLLNDSFSYEACEEIGRILEEEEDACPESYEAPALGDIVIRFCEIDEDDVDEDDDNILAHLSNGKVLIEK